MHRQLIDPEEWALHSGSALGDRIEWSNRACGMAALRMILSAYGQQPPSLTELVKTGVERGALTDRGWLHAGIANLAAELGVPGRAEPVAAQELLDRLADGPLIISVSEKLPTDGRRGGHLIVARGFAESSDSQEPDILIRDPSSWGQDNDRVPLSRLAASYTGRAITFPRLGRLIAVLGEMLELGDQAAEAHREVGRCAAEQGIDLVVAVGGAMAQQLALAAGHAGVPEVALIADNPTATAYVGSILRPGDKVLVKASRGGMAWQIAQGLTGQPITGF
jgi:hypothetical protein